MQWELSKPAAEEVSWTRVAATKELTWKGVRRLESSHSRGSDTERGGWRPEVEVVVTPLEVSLDPLRKELALRMDARTNEGLPPCSQSHVQNTYRVGMRHQHVRLTEPSVDMPKSRDQAGRQQLHLCSDVCCQHR
jgi:hypothetical protein